MGIRGGRRVEGRGPWRRRITHPPSKRQWRGARPTVTKSACAPDRRDRLGTSAGPLPRRLRAADARQARAAATRDRNAAATDSGDARLHHDAEVATAASGTVGHRIGALPPHTRALRRNARADPSRHLARVPHERSAGAGRRIAAAPRLTPRGGRTGTRRVGAVARGRIARRLALAARRRRTGARLVRANPRGRIACPRTLAPCRAARDRVGSDADPRNACVLPGARVAVVARNAIESGVRALTGVRVADSSCMARILRRTHDRTRRRARAALAGRHAKAGVAGWTRGPVRDRTPHVDTDRRSGATRRETRMARIRDGSARDIGHARHAHPAAAHRICAARCVVWLVPVRHACRAAGAAVDRPLLAGARHRAVRPCCAGCACAPAAHAQSPAGGPRIQPARGAVRRDGAGCPVVPRSIALCVGDPLGLSVGRRIRAGPGVRTEGHSGIRPRAAIVDLRKQTGGPRAPQPSARAGHGRESSDGTLSWAVRGLRAREGTNVAKTTSRRHTHAVARPPEFRQQAWAVANRIGLQPFPIHRIARERP
jgi:hypothetical protein